MFEIEMKFPLRDPGAFLRAAEERGVAWTRKVAEVDTYFQHPCRDFALTDEALRLRRHLVTTAESCVFECLATYKGPKLPGPTKTRRELEFPLVNPENVVQSGAWCVGSEIAGGSKIVPELPTSDRYEQWREMFTALGFSPVLDVSKVRYKAEWTRQGRAVEVSLDLLVGVGWFLEIEMMSEEGGVAETQATLLDLAGEWGLQVPETRSYLEILQGFNQNKEA